MLPLISVIIPVYKVREYLPKCIDSVIGQDYENLEVILVNDGSPDDCGEICDEYASRDGRIKVIHKPNGGLSSARNAAIDVSKGEYLTFVDSDDCIDSDYCSFLYGLLEKHGADISVTPFRPVDIDGNDRSRQFSGAESVLGAETAMKVMFARDSISWAAQGKLYKRSLFDGVRYPVGALMEDKATTYKLYAKCDRIAYCDTPKYNYLLRQGSIMHSKVTDKHIAAFDIQLELDRYIGEHFPSALETSNAYTSRCALALLCQMRAAGYRKSEKTDELIMFADRYSSELSRCDLIDSRYKLLSRAILTLYRINKKKFYESHVFGIAADYVDRKLSEK